MVENVFEKLVIEKEEEKEEEIESSDPELDKLDLRLAIVRQARSRSKKIMSIVVENSDDSHPDIERKPVIHT